MLRMCVLPLHGVPCIHVWRHAATSCIVCLWRGYVAMHHVALGQVTPGLWFRIHA